MDFVEATPCVHLAKVVNLRGPDMAASFTKSMHGPCLENLLQAMIDPVHTIGC